jgi:hypothetical protein
MAIQGAELLGRRYYWRKIFWRMRCQWQRSADGPSGVFIWPIFISIWRSKGQSFWAGTIFGGKYTGACAVHGRDQLIAPPVRRPVDLGGGLQAVEAAKLADPFGTKKLMQIFFLAILWQYEINVSFYKVIVMLNSNL